MANANENENDNLNENDYEYEAPTSPVENEPAESQTQEGESQDPEALRAKEMDAYSKRVQKRIDKLTYEYHEAERAKEEAQRRAAELEQFAQYVFDDNQKLRDTIEWGRNEFATNLHEKFELAEKYAAVAYKQAYEAGDTEAMMKAQKVRDDIVVQRAKYADLPAPVPKEQFKFSRPEPQAQPQSQPQPQPQYQAPQQPLRPEVVPDIKATEWAERNSSWWGKDSEMTATALGVHQRLVNEGYDTTSDEYYGALNKRLVEIYPEKFGRPRRSSPVAPAGRSPATKKVTLTQAQREWAIKRNIPLELVAKEKADLEANGGY